MNRKKKKEAIHKQRLKKAKAKLAPKKKSTYISKAKRAEIAASASDDITIDSSTSDGKES